jgi:tRNA(Ile)-lysidine synthase
MIEILFEHLQTTRLIPSGARVIVACSGGADSMALADLLLRFDFEIYIAHANFQLRGEDSEADEALVRAFAEERGVPVRIRRFHAEETARERGNGLQEAARTLRYEWFDELAEELSADCIATAHHRDDQIETYLWHMLRGSSWSGFTGIHSQNGNIVRPLLFASKEDLLDHCKLHDVPYREDLSNADPKYARNRIRHELIPLLQSIRPGFEKNILRQMEAFEEIDYVLTEFLSSLTPQMIELRSDGLAIDTNELRQLPFQRLVLLRVARDYGFPARRVNEIVDLIDAPPGKVLYSKSHRIIRERNLLLITPKADLPPEPVLIFEETEEVHSPAHLLVSRMNVDEVTLDDDPEVACFDFDALEFPLTVRLWQHGDRMRPIGLEGSQKLSDIYTQAKLGTLEKEQATVITSGEKIIWAVGLKMADFAKVTADTKRILEIRMLDD